MDSSGNNYNGRAVGGITTATVKICNAAEIPNNNNASIFEAVDTGDDLYTVIGSSGTISLWYKGNSDWSSGTDKRLFDANDGNKYFFAEIGSDGRVKFFFEDGNDGDDQKTTDDALSIRAGVWKHLAFVWDVTNITAKIFVDGFEIYGANIADSLPDQLAASNFINVNLRAVRSNKNVCEPLLEGTQEISLSYNCDSPDQCLTPLSGIPIDANGSGDNTSTLTVIFDELGVSNLSGLNYPDAGRLTLS
ncbi:LamG domain-containing protein [Paraglaciecola sp. MB-3u-78]|uniref:LamG domain-containing protein n=1 Tax=Paraglaciecola sp. MB-3u-78 TaxID=2058332 RepID=UPI001E2938FC|nr:LamG domain-containing protein [Paraglaciecola sp. MB-3u-78]